MVISKKGGCTSSKELEKSVLNFRDSEKVGGILNEIFLLVITTMIVHFEVSRILINGGSCCDVMYSKVFKNMGPKKLKL